MPSVTLEATYLHDAADLTVYVELLHEDIGADTTPDASIEVRAGGRRRLITRPGHTDRLSYRVEQVDNATYLQLKEWTEEATRLVHRDPNGRVWWGCITSLRVDNRPASGGDLTDVDIAFERLDDDLEV